MLSNTRSNDATAAIGKILLYSAHLPAETKGP